MSKTLTAARHFLKLLLEMDRAQQRALLYTVTLPQARALVEIFHNLDSLLPAKQRHLKPHTKTLIKQLVRVSLKKKAKLIQDHHLTVTRVLLSVKSRLLPLLR